MTDYRLEPPAWDEYIPVCPVCGEECDTVYMDYEGEVAGCDRCTHLANAYEYLYEGESS